MTVVSRQRIAERLQRIEECSELNFGFSHLYFTFSNHQSSKYKYKIG